MLRDLRGLRFLPHGDFPGTAAGGRLQQVDAAWQVDEHIVLQVLDAAHLLTGHVIDDGCAHVLAALDEDAAVTGDDLQGLFGLDTSDACGIDGDDVGRQDCT